MRDFFIIILLSFSMAWASAQQSKSNVPQSNGRSIDRFQLMSEAPVKNLASDGKHQISYYIGGGLSTFKYNPQIGAQKDGFGFSTGIDYGFFWHPKWGVTIGVSLDSYSSTIALNGVESSTFTKDGDVDNDGVVDEFYLISKFSGFKEKQSAMLIGVPIEFKFRQPFSPKVGMIVGVGPKFSTSINSSSQVNEGSYTTEGLYPKYGTNTVISDGPGFGCYSPRSSVTTDIGFGISAIGDLDFYYKINPAFILFAGPYFEYQVNTVSTSENKPLVQYNSTSPTEASSDYNPILTSSASNGANRFAVGGKIGLTFDFGGAKVIKNRNAQLRAEEAARLAELRRQATADSLANVARLAELRNKAIADSIANAQRLANEAARLALLAKLANEQRIKDSIENAKNVAVIMEIKTKTLSDEELALLKLPIIFAKGSADITDQSKINAQRIGEMFSHHPALILRITGHTCDLGDDKVNMRLGLRRAQTLFREFANAGVVATNITTFSKGETQPLFPNTNEDNRRKNRRVVVLIEDGATKKTEERIYK